MNKVLILGCLLTSSVLTYAQSIDTLTHDILKKIESVSHPGNNELKFNLLFSIKGKPEFIYERLIADKMGIGTAVFMNIEKSSRFKFGFIPYYRLYFGKKKASGLFIEGNTGIVRLEDEYWNSFSNRPTKIKTTNLTLGMAAGTKLITRNGFFCEAYIGYGKLVANRIGYNTQDVPRFGLVMGKRF